MKHVLNEATYSISSTPYTACERYGSKDVQPNAAFSEMLWNTKASRVPGPYLIYMCLYSLVPLRVSQARHEFGRMQAYSTHGVFGYTVSRPLLGIVASNRQSSFQVAANRRAHYEVSLGCEIASTLQDVL